MRSISSSRQQRSDGGGTSRSVVKWPAGAGGATGVLDGVVRGVVPTYGSGAGRWYGGLCRGGMAGRGAIDCCSRTAGACIRWDLATASWLWNFRTVTRVSLPNGPSSG